MGGSGGTGEGPTVNIDNSTNKMYVIQVSPVPFPQVLSQQQQCESGSRVNEISGLSIFQAEIMSRLEEVLYKWLESPPDTKDRQYELQSLHYQSTGRWLLQDFRFVKWKATPSSLWIKGICKSISSYFKLISNNCPAGTGKSVLR
jgi:hypothetical protein